MKNIIIIVIINILLQLTSCKKCYTCKNACCRRISTNELICSDQFQSNEEYWHFMDSLSSDIKCSNNTLTTFYKKVCSEDERVEYESKPGIGCTLIND